MPNQPHEVPALTAHEEHPGWRAYLNMHMLICVFLGFTSGLPLFTLVYLVQAWLRSEGVNLKEIGLFALIQFPYTWKFVWAPLMDRYVPRLPGWRPGRRRGWMLVTQLLVGVAIGTLGFVSPRDSIWTVAALTALVAFFGASQDIAVDAYRRELLTDTQQGLGNAVHVNAYKIAALVPGSLALILSDHLPWTTVFIVTAAFMLPGVAMTLVVREPEVHGTPPKNLRDAVLQPFAEFVNRDGWRAALFVLAFIFLYKLGDTMATTLSTSFFLDIGFSRTEIGVIAKTTAFGASLAGGIVGGVALMKIGIGRGLWIFGFLQMVSTLGFAWLAQLGADSPSLAAIHDFVIACGDAVTKGAAAVGVDANLRLDPRALALALVYGFETFATGLTLAAFTAYIASTTDPRYTATQFALFTSLAAVPRTLASAASGFLVTRIGWFDYFIVCTVLAVPGMLLLIRIAPWRTRS
ncbi:AmpG family muropeptide MFS transporter [Paraburkholderia caballeronis]|uniref:MFS transporter, PAT family, beta-lactamase induction signal transducer AmpG n=1 Tax=Paraburkholderia caballeronis TaxID=416943 RepID=A0A1H7HG58_9BURK|nr:AmpG family muropeptide MFS transporter [Paraburkholderia caballeronis]PXW29547.1 PAT family beta-lactamase induction signal transducer AmpG [Paraburkholderia caballeronis]PXX04806.1 PAT family beta-lactamase induction signal transducer AmpG [Paraburkholderia caballeronis]RAK05867.1 PAT family beta-lactamase induction signal transducer AmpG [Paraburkholderia caballeronis]SEB42500.1 MFS transporter, PAT family, beta-lactamase induction signal transducer AmpG [Paraburkholderia caballeronis]SE